MLKVWILVASIYFRFLTLDHCKVLCFALGSEYSSSSSPSDVVIMFFLTTQDCGSLDCITSSVLKDTSQMVKGSYYLNNIIRLELTAIHLVFLCSLYRDLSRRYKDSYHGIGV